MRVTIARTLEEAPADPPATLLGRGTDPLAGINFRRDRPGPRRPIPGPPARGSGPTTTP